MLNCLNFVICDWGWPYRLPWQRGQPNSCSIRTLFSLSLVQREQIKWRAAFHAVKWKRTILIIKNVNIAIQNFFSPYCSGKDWMLKAFDFCKPRWRSSKIYFFVTNVYLHYICWTLMHRRTHTKKIVYSLRICQIKYGRIYICIEFILISKREFSLIAGYCSLVQVNGAEYYLFYWNQFIIACPLSFGNS